MGYRIFSLFLIIIFSGCIQQSPEPMVQAAQVVEKPVTVAAPNLKTNYKLTYSNNPALQAAYNKYLKTGKAANVETDGFIQFAYGVATQPVVAASVSELTVISLEPGEKVTNVSSGDPTRWSYSMAYSGEGAKRQAHIMVKPAYQNISTDLVITTDKRLYTLKIVSTNKKKYIRDVRFWYPEEIQDYWDKVNAEQTEKLLNNQQTVVSDAPNLTVSNLNFNYSISSSGWHAPSWKPTRVFDDGVHTYIQFPQSISSSDMPVLFIKNGDKQELVNYRSKPPYFVVDKIFQQAVLVTNVGGDQTKVTITRL